MPDWLASFIQWLHGMGLHLGPDSAAALGQAAQSAGQAAARMDMPQLLALAAALGWASGVRLYAVVFLVGAMGAADWIALPAGLHLLQHPAVLAASGFMMFIEFFADKIPWLDSVWDGVHTFLRIPAGAALAAGVFGDSGQGTALAAAIIGGTLTAGTHFGKAGTRAAANTSPEPFSNLGLSLAEDTAVAGGLALAVAHPLVFLILLALFLVALIFLLRFIVRGIATLLRKLASTASAPT